MIIFLRYRTVEVQDGLPVHVTAEEKVIDPDVLTALQKMAAADKYADLHQTPAPSGHRRTAHAMPHGQGFTTWRLARHDRGATRRNPSPNQRQHISERYFAVA